MDLKKMRVRVAGRMKGHDRALCVMMWDKGSGQFLGQYILHQKDDTGAVDEPTPRRSSLWFIRPPSYSARRNAREQAKVDDMLLIATRDNELGFAKDALMEALERDAENRFIEFDVSNLIRKAA